MDDTMVTSAINHYDGIFKFVHSQRAKAPFLQARKLLSKHKISEALEKLRETQELCDNETDLKTITLVIEECKRYVEFSIQSTGKSNIESAQSINWTDVDQRQVERFEEEHDKLPQGVFLLKLEDRSYHGKLVILGRKLLSELWLRNLIPEIFCSQIHGEMFLGLVSDWRVTENKTIIFFHPFNPNEKHIVFAEVISNLTGDPTGVDLIFPLPLLSASARKELSSPADGWDVDPTYDQNLSYGEEHIRKVTIDFLREMNFTSHRFYDPACSTGVFLQSLKQAFPACETIGQDLSQKMCDVAKVRVDRVYCGNALSPKIAMGTADSVFVRFLNSEVVTTEEAGLLLNALLPTVAKGGIMIIFGHTPVLLAANDLRRIRGFCLLKNVALSMENNTIFQYYVIKRLE